VNTLPGQEEARPIAYPLAKAYFSSHHRPVDFQWTLVHACGGSKTNDSDILERKTFLNESGDRIVQLAL